MKILIQQYSSPFSTESLYLNECFNRTDGCATSYLWDWRVASAFDALDKVSPNVCIAHATDPKLNDIIKYLRGNTNIDLVLNITGINDSYLLALESILTTNNIKCPFFIYNNLPELGVIPSLGVKVVNLIPACDVFLPAQNEFNYSIGAAVISTNPEGIKPNALIDRHQTYHKIMLMQNPQDAANTNYDLHVGLSALPQFYGKYEEVILMDSAQVIFSQLFFDAMLYGKKVSLAGPPIVSKILDSLFIKSGAMEPGDLAEITKRIVRREHSCYNRALELALSLGATNLADILRKGVEKVAE